MANHTVQIGPRGFLFDGVETPLVGAQFEPFRHNPMYWRRSLEAIKNAGINQVSIFIAWAFHELTRGDFDFTGRTNPARDLKGFLELCSEMDMLVFARPGPIIDAEWETRGPAPDVMRLDRLHPGFLARTQEYIDAVCQVLVPAQVTRGGPVAMLAVDNEILYPYSTSKSQFDVDGDVYIPYDAEYYAAEFREWLREKYGSVEVVNERFGTDHSALDKIIPPRFGRDPVGLAYEAFSCLNSKIAEFTRRCGAMYRDAGIEVPTYTNMKQLLSYIDWPAVLPDLDSIGLNICMPGDMPGDQALVARWFYMLQRAQFAFPWSAEFQSGWIGLDDVFGFISEDHMEYMPLAAQAAGIRGMSFFMFVERDDWNYAPVNPMGKIRPGRYERMKRAVRSMRGLRQNDELLADVSLVWSRTDHQAVYMERDADWSELPQHWLWVDEAKELPAWWDTYRALTSADVDFDLHLPTLDVRSAHRIVVHAGGPLATHEHAEALARSLDEAEATVFVTPFPRRDLTGRPDPVLAALADACETAPSAIRCDPREVAEMVRSLGAHDYVRALDPGVWTFAYSDDTGAIVIGVWNASAMASRSPIRLGLHSSGDGPYELRHLASDEVMWAGLGCPELINLPMAAHSAAVLRLAPAADG